MNARSPELDHSEIPISLADLFNKCTLLEKDSPEEALELYRSWLDNSEDPNRHMAWFNYGSLLQGKEQTQDAINAYEECISLKPSFSQAVINLGLCYEKLGRKDTALQKWAGVVSYRLLKDAPSSEMVVMALNHIGRVQEILKQYDLAEQALEQSLAINPKQPAALQHWVHIRQKACSWPVYKPLPNISLNEMLMATSPLAMLALTDDPVQQLLTAFAFVERTYSFKEEFLTKGRKYQHNRIRIGYVSGDLCVHAVGVLLAELLEGHDHTKFEIYGYDYSPEDGTAHRERLKKAFDHLRNIKTLTDRQVAEQIMSDEIDFLIDMHGLSSGARPGIFALHPAPKQATYLGYMGTTGMPWFDFVIADRCSLPEELTKYYTEKPLYVEGTFIPLTKEDTTLREVKRGEFGLPSDAFVLAAFGNVYKITPEMFITWMDILKACPKAILWLLDDNPTTTANLKKQCVINGVDDKKIIFTPRTSPSEYKLKLRVADVFLDNYPYNCGSTTNDIINSFTPIVTMTGKSLVSKMGKSILEQFELRELIANDKNEYMKIIFNLYNNPELITKIKEKIKNKLKTLDRLAITKSIEKVQLN